MTNKLHVPGARIDRIRELDALPVGTIVRATSSPEPRYFRRYGSGWLACSLDGDTRLHVELWVALDGWPPVLPSSDLRRPATVVCMPDDEHPNELTELYSAEVVLA